MHRFPSAASALRPVVAALVLCGCAAKTPYERVLDEKWFHFGVVPDPTPAPSGAPIASVAALGESRGLVSLQGTIKEVCQAKGCWMTVRDEAGDVVLVRFRDYGFFVPRNAAGRQVFLQGEVSVERYSVEDLRHLASDAGRTAAQIAAIGEPTTAITFFADSVWIQGSGLVEPYRPVGDESAPPIDIGATS